MNLPSLRIAVVFVLLTAGAAWAEPIFLVHNEAALSRTTALPALGQASVLDSGQVSTRFAVDWSNEYVALSNARESLTLDGETGHINFGLRYGVAKGVEIGIDLPVLVTGGGVLDGLIESWHSAFGLANGGREFVPRNRYLYRYTRNGATLLNVNQAETGVGDIELKAGVALLPSLALRALVKLPIGDEDRLTGGNAGGAVWFDFDPFAGSARWFGFISGGGSYNAQSRVLSSQQRQWVGLGGLGAGYRLFSRVSVLAQFYAHTALYKNSDFKALSGTSGQLVFGGRIGLARHLSLDLGVEEDVLVNTAPDFGIHLGLNYH